MTMVYSFLGTVHLTGTARGKMLQILLTYAGLMHDAGHFGVGNYIFDDPIKKI